jgi:molybdate transport system permease protein
MFLSDPEWQAVLLSLKVSSLAVVLSLPFGIFFLAAGSPGFSR